MALLRRNIFSAPLTFSAPITVLALASPLLVSAACADRGPDRPDGVYAEFHTTKGVFVARLEPDRAPLATANLVGLAEGTIENEAFDLGRPFYDGSEFHRVVEGHVIQAGQAASQRAQGPGYQYPNEIHADLSHDHAGALGVANAGPHTNGSQFYVTLGDRSYLDGSYIVFGDVVEGMGVVMSIVQGDFVDSVRIARHGAAAEAYHPDTNAFRDLVSAAQAHIDQHAARKPVAEREWLASQWPDAAFDGELTTVSIEGGSGVFGTGPKQVRYSGTAVIYVGHLLGNAGSELELRAFGSDGQGAPGFIDPAETFTFVGGETSINRGLDRVIAEMSAGERRTLIVPAASGYAQRGYYRPDTPGQPRFVIPANTLLVYEIEVLDEG